MNRLKTEQSFEPFDIENIIAMLAASPERDYEVIARMASKLVSEDTIDLTDLGNDLTLTDKKQMLGVASSNCFDDRDVIQLIEEKGVNSPEYEFALERRLRLTLKQVLQGVKKKRDKEDKRIVDSIVGSRPANINTWVNQRILSASLRVSDRDIFEPVEVKLSSEDPYVEEDVYFTDSLESPEFIECQEDYSEEYDWLQDIF